MGINLNARIHLPDVVRKRGKFSIPLDKSNDRLGRTQTWFCHEEVKTVHDSLLHLFMHLCQRNMSWGSGYIRPFAGAPKMRKLACTLKKSWGFWETRVCKEEPREISISRGKYGFLIAQLEKNLCIAGDPRLIPGSRRSTGEGKGYTLQYSWASREAQLVKNPPAKWETWVGKIPWRRESLPTPVFWPGEFHGLYSPWGPKDSSLGFPHSSVSKESAYNAGDLGSIPRSGRSPGEGNGTPLQYSCLENPHGQRSLAGYSPWGRKSQTQLNDSISQPTEGGMSTLSPPRGPLVLHPYCIVHPFLQHCFSCSRPIFLKMNGIGTPWKSQLLTWVEMGWWPSSPSVVLYVTGRGSCAFAFLSWLTAWWFARNWCNQIWINKLSYLLSWPQLWINQELNCKSLVFYCYRWHNV